MENLQNKIYRLINQLKEDELKEIWETIYTLHCDFEVKKAIQEVQELQQPWDFLSHEEARQYLEESGDGEEGEWRQM